MLKAPQIRSNGEVADPSASVHRNRVIRLFDTASPKDPPTNTKYSGLKTSGGYIYISSRQKGDPLGLKRNQNGKVDGVVTRCGVLVEYPKNTGEVKPPGESGDIVFPSSNADAYRFPSDGDPLKIRLYTAAHCLDYSLNESVVLKLLKGNEEISSPDNDYLEVPIEVPEIASIKNLRREVKKKIAKDVVTEEQGIQMLNAFRPAVGNLSESFGTSGAQGKCAEKLPNPDVGTKQYSCATYHDMAVLDVTLPDGLPAETIAKIKSLRTAWVTNIKAEEAIGPWSEYVKPAGSSPTVNLKLFVDHLLDSEKSDIGKESNPSTCKALPTYELISGCYTSCSASCPPSLIDPVANSACQSTCANNCPTMTTKLGLFYAQPANCLEVAIDTPNRLSFVRHITRERLRTFSQYNMAAQLLALTSSGLRLDS